MTPKYALLCWRCGLNGTEPVNLVVMIAAERFEVVVYFGPQTVVAAMMHVDGGLRAMMAEQFSCVVPMLPAIPLTSLLPER